MERIRLQNVLQLIAIICLGCFFVAAQDKTQEDKEKVEQTRRSAVDARRAELAPRAQSIEVRRRMVEARQAAVEARKLELARRRAEVRVRKTVVKSGTFRLLWSKFNVDFRNVVRGAPYSAVAVTEHIQTLSDGNQIIKKSSAHYYRDSEGRVRTETKIDNVRALTSESKPVAVIMIADPVAGRLYSLNPNEKTAEVQRYAMYSDSAKQKTEFSELAAALRERTRKAANQGTAGETNAARSDERVKTEAIGPKMMEGVQVEGLLSVRTIPAGEIGNTRPIQIVDETWYSTDLHLRVLIRHSDPRSGDSLFRLESVNRSEPSSSLFQVPADYKVVERVDIKIKVPPKPPTSKQ
jgi:hypothetical protein